MNKITLRSLAKFLCSAALTGLLLAAVFRTESLSSFGTMLQNVNRSGVAIYIGISILALFARALRYHLVLKVVQREEVESNEVAPTKFSTLLIVTSIRNALVDFLPARLGELSYFYILKRYGITLTHALSVFGLCFALDIAVLALLLLALLFASPYYVSMQSFVDTSEVPVLLLVIAGLGLLGISLSLLRLDLLAQFGTRFLSWISRPLANSTIRERLLTFSQNITKDLSYIRQGGSNFQFIGLTLVLRISKYLSLYVLLWSVVSPMGISHRDLDPLLSTIAFLCAEASASLPVSGLMGFGAYEGAWSLVFSLSKAEIPSIPSVILLVHLITQVGGYSLALLGLGAFLTKEVKS